MSRRGNQPLHKVRITALRQTVYTDLMAQYENPIEHACSVHEGQQWIAVDGRRPDGLCPAAWESMRRLWSRWRAAKATSTTAG